MDPINYMGMVPQIDLGKQFLTGLQTGAGIGEIQQQSDARALAIQQAQQYKVDAAAALANPTPQAFSALALKYPTQREAVKQSWDGLSAADQKAEGDTMSQAYAAYVSGQPELAKKIVRDQIVARKNSGLDTAHFDSYLSTMDTDPTHAQGAIGLILSHIGDPKDFAAKFGALQKLPGELADADATTTGKVVDNQAKAAAVTGARAGALAQAKNLKPSQVETFLRTEAAAGRIPKAELADRIAAIPADPKALPDYLNSLRDAGIKPDEQKKFTTPDANAQLQAQTSRYSTDSAARTAGARLAFDKDQAAAEDAPDNTPDAEKKLWVHQYVAGNGSVPRSAPASVRSHIGTWAAQMGITPADLSSGSAQAKFDQASAVTSGHRAGGMASVEASMPALTANAMSLSRKLDQGKFVPLNKLVQIADDKISDPTLAAFKVAHMAVVSEYQQVIGRGGTNVTALKEAMHVLNGATSPQAYDAALNQVNKEVAINVAGTKAVRAGLGAGGHSAPAPTAGAAPAIPAGWSVKEH